MLTRSNGGPSSLNRRKKEEAAPKFELGEGVKSKAIGVAPEFVGEAHALV